MAPQILKKVAHRARRLFQVEDGLDDRRNSLQLVGNFPMDHLESERPRQGLLFFAMAVYASLSCELSGSDLLVWHVKSSAVGLLLALFLCLPLLAAFPRHAIVTAEKQVTASAANDRMLRIFTSYFCPLIVCLLQPSLIYMGAFALFVFPVLLPYHHRIRWESEGLQGIVRTGKRHIRLDIFLRGWRGESRRFAFAWKDIQSTECTPDGFVMYHSEESPLLIPRAYTTAEGLFRFSRSLPRRLRPSGAMHQPSWQ